MTENEQGRRCSFYPLISSSQHGMFLKKVHFDETLVKIRVWRVGHYSVSGLASCETYENVQIIVAEDTNIAINPQKSWT